MNSNGQGDDHAQLLNGIRVVVFDAVGTLMYPEPSVASVYADVIQRRTKQPVDIAVVRQLLSAALSRRNTSGDLRTSEADEAQFWLQLIEQLCPVSAESQNCFEELFAYFARAESWRCFPDADGLIQNLQQRGIAVAIGSNFDSRLHSVCDGLPQLAGVEHRFISSEVGWRKPAPGFYESVADRTGCAPDRILMVGDDLLNDIEGALSAGLRAAWISRSETAGTTVRNARFARLTSLTQLIADRPEFVHAGKDVDSLRDSGARR